MTTRRKPARPPRRFVPAFVPVPLRARRDGWTPRRQAAFLGHLAETGSVSEAAQRVRMARETAYRLRARPGAESFALAWDVALGRAAPVRHPARKVTGDELWQRAFRGVLQPVLYAGRYTGTVRKADDAALLRVLANPASRGRTGGAWSHAPWAETGELGDGFWWPREGGEGE